MKHPILYLVSVVMGIGFLMCSCSQTSEPEEPVPQVEPKNDQPVPIVLHYALDKAPDTRTASQTLQTEKLESSNKAGISIIDSINKKTVYANVRYDVGENETLTPHDADNPPMVSEGQQLTAIAYLPHREEWPELKEYDFEVQKDQTSDADYLASDLIWGKTDDITSENVGKIDLPLTRRMSRWKLDVVLDDHQHIADFRGAKLAIYGIKRATKINLANGEVSKEASGALRVITYHSVPDDATETSQLSGMLLVPPQTIGSKQCYLRVTFKDGVKVYFAFSPVTFLPKHVYTSTVHLHGYGLDMTAEIEPFKETVTEGELTSND